MKILFATDNFYPNMNGAANFAYRLIEGLIKRGHQICVIAPSLDFKNRIDFYKGMTIYGIRSIMIPRKIYPAGLRVPLPFTIRSAGIKRLIERINPDVIHILDHFMIGSRVAKVGKSMGKPMVGTNNSIPENFVHYLYPTKFFKKLVFKAAWKQLAGVYKNLDIVTSPSEAACALLKNLSLKNKIQNVSCGVDLKKFNPQNNGAYLKKRFQIPDNKPVTLFVGRLDREKNLETVIGAFAKVLKSSESYLVIAGEGKEKSKLIDLTKTLKIEHFVVFIGLVSEKDLPFLYSMADIFVIASSAELQSIATMEAMASGQPVVAADALALPELVHHGKNGYLFKEGDSDSLAQSILNIISNRRLRKKMSEESLKIISGHDLSKTVETFADIYRIIGR